MVSIKRIVWRWNKGASVGRHAQTTPRHGSMSIQRMISWILSKDRQRRFVHMEFEGNKWLTSQVIFFLLCRMKMVSDKLETHDTSNADTVASPIVSFCWVHWKSTYKDPSTKIPLICHFRADCICSLYIAGRGKIKVTRSSKTSIAAIVVYST